MAIHETVRSDKLAEVAGATVDRLSELAREHIELARIQVGGELGRTVETALWMGAGGLGVAVASILLIAGVFDLAGAIIPSVGARLVILAVLTAAASYALVLKGSARARAKTASGPADLGVH